MRSHIFADDHQDFNAGHQGQWLTTADVARRLAITTEGVRWLVRTQQLACECTASGLRLFRPAEVWRVVHARAEKRGLRRRPLMAKADLEPRQLPLFGARARLGRDRGERVA